MNLATLADQNLEQYGEYPRLWFEGRDFTNRELHEASCRLATALGALGVAPGERVVVLLPNAPEVLVAYAGIWRAGAVAVPVLFLLEQHEVRHIVENCRARALITAPELLDKARAALAGLPTPPMLISTGAAEPDARSLPALVAEHAPRPVAEPRAAADLAVLLYTSGTTGRPKGVQQTHGNLLANAHNAWNSSVTRDRTEVGLLVLPLAHSFGLGVLVSGYLHGTRAVLMRWFDAERCLALIGEHRIATMAGVPTMFVAMLMHPRAAEYDTSSMRRWLVGAAPMPVAQREAFEQRFGGVMYVGYGLTESCPGIATEREGRPRKPGSTGIPLEGVTVKVVDEQGQEVPRGQPGEVLARGANISPGYFELPEETAQTFRDGWLHTGDIGVLDEDGVLFIVERKKDLVIRGGFNVYPKDVEGVLVRHPAVAEAAVVGVPDALMGEEVAAFVVLRPGGVATPEELTLHCQGELARYKCPRFLAIEPYLPKTVIGKVQKKELRRMAAERWAAPA